MAYNPYGVKLIQSKLRPDFFYFMVYRRFWASFNIGIRNKNENKVSIMSDLHCSQCTYQATESLFLDILKN